MICKVIVFTTPHPCLFLNSLSLSFSHAVGVPASRLWGDALRFLPAQSQGGLRLQDFPLELVEKAVEMLVVDRGLECRLPFADFMRAFKLQVRHLLPLPHSLAYSSSLLPELHHCQFCLVMPLLLSLALFSLDSHCILLALPPLVLPRSFSFRSAALS